MTENYLIFRNYKLYHSNKNTCYLYHPDLSLKLNDKVSQFFNSLEKVNNKKIAKNEVISLIKKCELPINEFLTYLTNDIKIAAEVSNQSKKCLYLFTENTEIKNELSLHYKLSDIQIIDMHDKFPHLNENSIVIFFLADYSINKYQSLIQEVYKKNAWVLTFYILNKYLIIDPPYKKDKGLPCHFCNFNQFQEQLNASATYKNSSWLKFCRNLMENNIDKIPSISVNTMNRGLVIFWMIRSINFLITISHEKKYIEEVGQYKSVDLLEGEVYVEQAIHSSLCDCVVR